jgi:hypothetical protein
MKRVSILGTGMRFSLPQNIQTDSAAHPASCEWVLKAFPRGQSGWDMKITTHIIPVPMLGMSVAILPFPNTPSCSVEGKI